MEAPASKWIKSLQFSYVVVGFELSRGKLGCGDVSCADAQINTMMSAADPNCHERAREIESGTRKRTCGGARKRGLESSFVRRCAVLGHSIVDRSTHQRPLAPFIVVPRFSCCTREWYLVVPWLRFSCGVQPRSPQPLRSHAASSNDAASPDREPAATTTREVHSTLAAAAQPCRACSRRAVSDETPPSNAVAPAPSW